jgi:hypothetical protein
LNAGTGHSEKYDQNLGRWPPDDETRELHTPGAVHLWTAEHLMQFTKKNTRT